MKLTDMGSLGLVVVVGLVGACGNGNNGPSTGTSADGGATNDVTVTADTGPGSQADAGGQGDTAVGADTGSETDADSATNDAGSAADADSTDDAGTADVGVDSGPVDMGPGSGDGDTCAAAIDATGGGTFMGDTSTAKDDYSSNAAVRNCPQGTVSGGDIVYRLSPTVETNYFVTVTPSSRSYDPFLYVKEDCALDACIDGTVLNGSGTQESMNIQVPAGATYYLIVDGELGTSGPYTLTLTFR